MSSADAIPFAMPDIGEDEIDAVVSVLRSKWLTTGQRSREFEANFAEVVGASHAIALNSCTAALHLSLEALGVSQGDLVFMSPYTFAATAEVVRYLGAIPVFVDIDAATLNLDVVLLREAIESRLDLSQGRPAAIMPVHMAGSPCEMDAVWDIAREHGLSVVEDAAHAFPAARKGRVVGKVPADISGTACFSFYATKTITTGEGGMVTTENEEVADRVRTMSLHGLSRQAWSRYSAGGSWKYDILAPGFKYNLSDIAAALGVVQLRRADEMAARRREIAETYTRAFSELSALECPTVPEDADSSWHLYVLRLHLEQIVVGRDEFIDKLAMEGVGTSVHFIPLHLHSYYRDQYGLKPADFPVALREYERAMSLPIYSAMDDSDVERVVSTVRGLAAKHTDRGRH